MTKVMTPEEAASLQRRARVSVEATYEEGHFEEPNFGCLMLDTDGLPIDLPQKVRYRVDGLLLPGMLPGTLCVGYNGADLQPSIIEALTHGRPAEHPGVRARAYRSLGCMEVNGLGEYDEPRVSRIEVLTGHNDGVVYVAVIRALGRDGDVSYVHDPCRSAWWSLFAEGSSCFWLFGPFYTEPAPYDGKLPSDPAEGVLAVREHLLRAIHRTPNQLGVEGVIMAFGEGTVACLRMGGHRVLRRTGKVLDTILWEHSLRRYPEAAGAPPSELPDWTRNVSLSRLEPGPPPCPVHAAPTKIGDRWFILSGRILEHVSDEAVADVLRQESPGDMAAWLEAAETRFLDEDRPGTFPDWGLVVVDVVKRVPVRSSARRARAPLVLAERRSQDLSAPAPDQPNDQLPIDARGAMDRDTRWLWMTEHDGSRLLVFTYEDPWCGVSAKGGVVGDPPSRDEVLAAINDPDYAYRNPKVFGAVPLSEEEELSLDLPSEPPWVEACERIPVPPPRTVTARVRRRGAPVAGACVRIGSADGPLRSFFEENRDTTDATGTCEFRRLRPRPIAAIASQPGLSSKLLDVPDDGVIELSLLDVGALSGVVRQNGVAVSASISIGSTDGGVYRVQHSDEAGRYRVEGIVPGTYEITVERIHPATLMPGGTPACDTIVVAEGESLRRDYALLAGVSVRVTAFVENNQHDGEVYLFAGEVAPRHRAELRSLFEATPRIRRRAANSYTNDGFRLTTELTDVTPGSYTVCVTPSLWRGGGHPEQPVVTRHIVVDGAPVHVEITLPPRRPA
jgi:hypothetical protein